MSKEHPTFTPEAPASVTPITQPPTPEVPPEVRELLTKLMDECASLVIKTAICECDKKDTCVVYKKAQGLAKIIDKLTELRSKGMLGGTGSG